MSTFQFLKPLLIPISKKFMVPYLILSTFNIYKMYEIQILFVKLDTLLIHTLLIVLKWSKRNSSLTEVSFFNFNFYIYDIFRGGTT